MKKYNKNNNLKPFIKGDPRINRLGKKKGTVSIATIINELLDEEIEYTNQKTGEVYVKARRYLMVMKQIEKAILDRDTQAFKELADRAEGKVVQKSEISGSNGATLKEIKIAFENKPSE